MNKYVKRYNPNGLSILGLGKFYLIVYYDGSYMIDLWTRYMKGKKNLETPSEVETTHAVLP